MPETDAMGRSLQVIIRLLHRFVPHHAMHLLRNTEDQPYFSGEKGWTSMSLNLVMMVSIMTITRTKGQEVLLQLLLASYFLYQKRTLDNVELVVQLLDLL